MREDSATVFQKRHAQVHWLGFARAPEDFRRILGDVRAAHLIGGVRAAAMKAERTEHRHATRGHNHRHTRCLAEITGLVTSSVIAHMLAVGEHFVALELTPSGQEESGVPPFAVLGTPQQLREHLRAVPCAPHRFCFDLDGTLVSAPRVPGDYSTCEPIAAMVEHARKLHAAGHTIIVHTARRMRTHRGNVGGVIADIGAVTIAQLKAFGVPFDELVFGKPYAHFYIDDRGTLLAFDPNP